MDVHTIVQGRSRRWHAWMLELLSWALMLPNEASRPQNLMIQNTHTHTLYRQKRGIFMRLHSKRRCISFHHVSLVTICYKKHVSVKVDLGHCPSIFLHSLPRDWKALWPGNGPPEQTGQLQPTKLHRNATIFNHGEWTRSYGYFTSQSKWQKGSIKNQYRDMKQLGLGMINCWAIHPRKYAIIELIHKQPHICNHQHMVPNNKATGTWTHKLEYHQSIWSSNGDNYHQQSAIKNTCDGPKGPQTRGPVLKVCIWFTDSTPLYLQYI